LQVFGLHGAALVTPRLAIAAVPLTPPIRHSRRFMDSFPGWRGDYMPDVRMTSPETTSAISLRESVRNTRIAA
jgi:hypothetical protein